MRDTIRNSLLICDASVVKLHSIHVAAKSLNTRRSSTSASTNPAPTQHHRRGESPSQRTLESHLSTPSKEEEERDLINDLKTREISVCSHVQVDTLFVV